jgi:hypothetical protein
MAFKISVEASSLDYEIDAPDMALAIAEGMRDFYAGQLDAGRQPDGSPLPLNAEGKPLGKGDGSIVRGWKANREPSNRRLGRASAEPGQSGKLAIAVARLRRRGVKFQGVTGAAAQELARLISDEVDRQHRSAARGRDRQE